MANRSKKIRGFYWIIIIVLSVIIAAMSDSLRVSQKKEIKSLKKLIKVNNKNIWLQDRLKNCTECNYIHFKYISECDECKSKAMKNQKLNELYTKLE